MARKQTFVAKKTTFMDRNRTFVAINQTFVGRKVDFCVSEIKLFLTTFQKSDRLFFLRNGRFEIEWIKGYLLTVTTCNLGSPAVGVF